MNSLLEAQLIKAYLFDLDNTLHDRTGAYERYSTDFLNNHFNNISKDEYEQKFSDMIELDNNGYISRQSMFNQLISKWKWDNGPGIDKLVEEYYAQFYKYTRFTPNMEYVLNELKKNGFKLGIITNGPSTQYKKIDQLGLRSLFDIILVSDEVGYPKPQKEIFNIACKMLHIKNEEACYIGDHFTNDIIGATNAGLKAVWYTYRGYPENSDIALLPPNTTVIYDIKNIIGLE